jgi:hypothetical protein
MSIGALSANALHVVSTVLQSAQAWLDVLQEWHEHGKGYRGQVLNGWVW